MNRLGITDPWALRKAAVTRNLEELNRLLDAVRLAQERIDSGTNRLALFVAAYLLSWGAFNFVAAYIKFFPKESHAFDIFVLLNSLVLLPILVAFSWRRWLVLRREQTIRDATAAILWQLYRSRIDEIKMHYPLDGAFLYIQMAQYDFGDLSTNPLAIEAFSGLRKQKRDHTAEASTTEIESSSPDTTDPSITPPNPALRLAKISLLSGSPNVIQPPPGSPYTMRRT